MTEVVRSYSVITGKRQSLSKEADKHIYEYAQEGNLCMDESITNDWEHLKKLVSDRDSWSRKVISKMTKKREPHHKPKLKYQISKTKSVENEEKRTSVYPV